MSDDGNRNQSRARCAHLDICHGRIDRRQALSLAGSATAGLVMLGAGAVPGCGNPTGSPPTGPVPAGNISALSVGELRVFSNVTVARDSSGVYAMSAVCTHADCLMSDGSGSISGGLSCPCHGSTFDGNGRVTHGPANAPLQHYAVTIAADGSLTVEGAQPVDSAARTPVM